jgi:hypothetical protein
VCGEEEEAVEGVPGGEPGMTKERKNPNKNEHLSL